MVLTTQEITDAYNTALIDGHADPVGLLARMKVLSGFDPDAADESRGLSGLAMLSSADSGIYDINTLLGQVRAAVALDVANHAEYGNVEEMHLSSHFTAQEVRDRGTKTKMFLDSIDKARSVVASIVGADGSDEATSNEALRAAISRDSTVHYSNVFTVGGGDANKNKNLPEPDIDQGKEDLIRKVVEMMENYDG